MLMISQTPFWEDRGYGEEIMEFGRRVGDGQQRSFDADANRARPYRDLGGIPAIRPEAELIIDLME